MLGPMLPVVVERAKLWLAPHPSHCGQASGEPVPLQLAHGRQVTVASAAVHACRVGYHRHVLGAEVQHLSFFPLSQPDLTAGLPPVLMKNAAEAPP